MPSCIAVNPHIISELYQPSRVPVLREGATGCLRQGTLLLANHPKTMLSWHQWSKSDGHFLRAHIHLNSGQNRAVFRSQRHFNHPDASPNDSTTVFRFSSTVYFLALLKRSHISNSIENCGSFPQWLAQKAWQCCWLPEMQITRLASTEIRSFISHSKSIQSSWNLIFSLAWVKMCI